MFTAEDKLKWSVRLCAVLCLVSVLVSINVPDMEHVLSRVEAARGEVSQVKRDSWLVSSQITEIKNELAALRDENQNLKWRLWKQENKPAPQPIQIQFPILPVQVRIRVESADPYHWQYHHKYHSRYCPFRHSWAVCHTSHDGVCD